MDISLRDFGLRNRRARGQFAIQAVNFSVSETRVRSAVNSNSLGTFIWQGTSKSPPKNRNRENLAKWPHIIVNGHFSAGLWAKKPPCTRSIRYPSREFLCIGDSGAERSQFELSGDFHLARNFKVPSEKSKQRESCQMAPHHREWTFLCGTLG